METLYTSTAIALLLVAFAAGWFLTLLGMPGNWLIVAAGGMYCWLGPATGRSSMSLVAVGVMLALAALGEILEFALGAVGARKAGGGRRAASGALVGSLGGAVAGLFVGLPIPVIGPMVSAVLFAAGGAMAGAYCMQRSDPGHEYKAWKVGKAAFWGRLAGTVAKLFMGTAMIAVAVAALLWN